MAKIVMGELADSLQMMEQMRYRKVKETYLGVLQRWWRLPPDYTMPQIDLDSAITVLFACVSTICNFINTKFPTEKLPLPLQIYKRMVIGEQNYHMAMRNLLQQDTTTVPDYYEMGAQRDKEMGNNLEFMLHDVFPDKKVVVWAHNAHIAKMPDHGVPWMGNLLPEKIKQNSYVIGILANSGEINYNSTSQQLPDKAENTVEYMLNACNHNAVFVDLTELPRKSNTQLLFDAEFYLNYEESVKGNIKDYFDGVILIPSLSPLKQLYEDMSSVE
jgi:hypothetical protein